MKILGIGAEAVIKADRNSVIKERVKKPYRVAQLDESIRKQRTNMEASLLNRARRSGVCVPVVLGKGDFALEMEFVDGERVKEVLNCCGEKEAAEISGKIGEVAGKLHSAGIVHGDLTTSNMILTRSRELVLIDFGLGKFSSKLEDQATDLYLFYEALKSTHFRLLAPCWGKFLEGYKSYPKSADVLKRFEEISRRRRYKTD